MTQKVLTPRPKIGKIEALPQVVKAMVFGDSGAGKTTLLSTLPRPLLITSTDSSLSSLSGAEGISVYPDPEDKPSVETWGELLGVLDWVEEAGHKEFRTWSIDTITEAGTLLQKQILSGEGPTRRAFPGTMSQADWGIFADHMLEFIRRVRDLPMNVMLTAQVQDQVIDDPAGGSEMIRSASFGGGQKVPSLAPAYFDMVGYLGVEPQKDGTVKRKMLVQPIGNRRAKIRTSPTVDVEPVVIEDPNLTEIFKMITGGK